MRPSRLTHIPGIGVDEIGNAADAAADPDLLRLENLDTDLRPPDVAVELTRAAVDDDAANSYLPFHGHPALRTAAAAHVSRLAGADYSGATDCVITAGGLNGVLNVLLAVVEPGREVVIGDPIYAGLVNRIRLAGGIPRHVPATATPDGWLTDPQALAAAVGPQTAAVLVMSPAMPTGGLLGAAHWDALAAAVDGLDCWVVYDAAMERIRFDGAPPAHPAAHPGLVDRTITVGSASKELRLIGWRVGWVVGPAAVIADVNLVGLTNVVCPVGIAQQGVAAALLAPDADADVMAVTEIWRQRCATVLAELAGYPCVRPGGGWSLLVDVAELGLTPGQAAERLFRLGRVAATPMDGWGPAGRRYVRLVYANEPVGRLAGLRDRFAAALG